MVECVLCDVKACMLCLLLPSGLTKGRNLLYKVRFRHTKKTNPSKSRNSSSGKLACSYCRRMGHTVKECRTKKQAASLDAQQQGSSRVECWVCNRKGHRSRDCKKRDEYRDAISARARIDRNNVMCFFLRSNWSHCQRLPEEMEEERESRMWP